MEQDETTVCPICGGSNIYESGEFLGCADCHAANTGGVAVSDELENQVVYWRQKVDSDPVMLDQLIRAMLLSRQTQAQAETRESVAVMRAEAAEQENRDLRRTLAAANADREAAKVAEWVATGPCPLCAAKLTRASYDDANHVRVSYCLHCKAAILWTQGEVQP